MGQCVANAILVVTYRFVCRGTLLRFRCLATDVIDSRFANRFNLSLLGDILDVDVMECLVRRLYGTLHSQQHNACRDQHSKFEIVTYAMIEYIFDLTV